MLRPQSLFCFIASRGRQQKAGLPEPDRYNEASAESLRDIPILIKIHTDNTII